MAAEWLETFSLGDAATRQIRTYSGGMKRRLDLAGALINRPDVLFLDEPTTGLDAQSRRALWDRIREMRNAGTTVFLTTQYLEEAEVRTWLEDYARAWSRKDVVTLQHMGQVRSASEVERLERYFGSIDALDVEVRVLALRVEGEHAVVDLERVDTVTDPTGRRQQLRLPPLHKQIERTPAGLRFVDDGGHG